MKNLHYIALAFMVLLAGCEDPIEGDKNLIDGFDHTAPAYVMMTHSMKVLAAASGTLIHACNLNEWLSAENEEARLAVEDKYYPYLKVREVEENLWNIYSYDYTESYYLNGGLLLNEVGAEWEVRHDPIFTNVGHTSSTPITKPTITCVDKDSFEVTFSGMTIYFGRDPQVGLYDYLTRWGGGYGEQADVTLLVQTNNSAFRKGEESVLKFVISGEGKIHNHSEYGVRFTIQEPIEMSFGTDGNMLEGSVGVGVLRVTNSVNMESVTATFSPYNAIILNYKHKSGENFVGYYDWTGNILTPR